MSAQFLKANRSTGYFPNQKNSLTVEGIGIWKIGKRNVFSVAPSSIDLKLKEESPNRPKQLVSKPRIKKKDKVQVSSITNFKNRDISKPNRQHSVLVLRTKGIGNPSKDKPHTENSLLPLCNAKFITWQERVHLFAEKAGLKSNIITQPKSNLTESNTNWNRKLDSATKLDVNTSKPSIVKHVINNQSLQKSVYSQRKLPRQKITLKKATSHGLFNGKDVLICSYLPVYQGSTVCSTATSDSTTIENQYQFGIPGEFNAEEMFSENEEVDLPSLSTIKSTFSSNSSVDTNATYRKEKNSLITKMKPKIQVISSMSEQKLPPINGTSSFHKTKGKENPSHELLLPPLSHKESLRLDIGKSSTTKPRRESVTSQRKVSITKHKVIVRPNSEQQDYVNQSRKLTDHNRSLRSADQRADITEQFLNDKGNNEKLSCSQERLNGIKLQTVRPAQAEQPLEEKKQTRKFLRQLSSEQVYREKIRLQRIRDDIVRRNMFLKNATIRAKEDLQETVPDDKITELTKRKEALQNEQMDLNKQIQIIKSRKTRAEKMSRNITLEIEENTNQLKEAEQQKKNYKQDLQTATLEQKDSERNLLSFLSNEQSLECQLNDVTTIRNIKKKQQIDKDVQNKAFLEKLSILQKQEKQDDLESEHQNCEYERRLKQMHETEKLHQTIKQELEKSLAMASSTAKELKQLKLDLVSFKKESQNVASQLSQAQRDFRRKEEIKSNVLSSKTQTTGRLVILRDIAWIRVAEEEVLLSPLCRAKEETKSQDDNFSAIKLPVGAMTPVFEVYNLATSNEGASISPAKLEKPVKKGTTLHNKRLADARSGSEYMWTGEDQ